MATKAKSSPKKTATSTKKPATRKPIAARKAKSTAKGVDYYPNRVPFLAALTGVSFLMVIALLVTL